MRSTPFGRWASALVLGLGLPLLLGPVSDASEAGPAATAPVTGRVLDAAGAPVVGVDVRAFQRWDSGSFRTEAETVTDADGRYSMDLEPGTYQILFEPRYGSNLADEYWGGVYRFAFAQDEIPTFVIVEGTPVPDKDIVLDATATITGSVVSSDPSVETFPGAAAYRWVDGEWLWAWGDYSETDPEPGRYQIERLPPGTYRIALGGGNGFIDQFWPGATTVASATDITVAPGSVVDGVDARLDPYGRIIGRLVNAAGQGIPDFPVHADAEGNSNAFGAKTWTDERGYYVLNAIPYARYTLRFGGGLARCDSEYYHEQVDPTAAEELVIPPAATETVTIVAKAQTLTCPLEATKEPQPFGFDPAQFDKPLGVVPPEFDVPGVDIAYQWFRIGFPISGATSFWYVPVFADVPHNLTLQVTASRPGFDSKVWRFDSFVYPGTIRSKVFPRIKGAPRVGETLRVTRGKWTPTDVKIHRYQWLSDGVTIRGATGRRLVVTRKHLDRRISVRFVVYTANGSYLAREFVTKSTKRVAPRT